MRARSDPCQPLNFLASVRGRVQVRLAVSMILRNDDPGMGTCGLTRFVFQPFQQNVARRRHLDVESQRLLARALEEDSRGRPSSVKLPPDLPSCFKRAWLSASPSSIHVPAILPCKAKLRSLSDRGGCGVSSVGPRAGKYWKQENSANPSAALPSISGRGSTPQVRRRPFKVDRRGMEIIQVRVVIDGKERHRDVRGN